MKLRQLFILLIFFIPFGLKAVKLDIGIFHNIEKKEIVFTSITGKYHVRGNQQDFGEVLKGNSIRIAIFQDSLLNYYQDSNLIGQFREIHLKSKGFMNAFSIKISNSTTKLRKYDDDLIIRIYDNKIQLVNRVGIENYTAGVVQSEALGSSKDLQFFFVQAITCRTYALVNYLKHTDEGFNLCDDVHCQYYSSRCHHSDITRATARTSGEVIVDDDNRMISAAFHSNCGGQTINSENVWTIETSYLKSVIDTCCTHESNAHWEYMMTKTDWLNFLHEKYNYPIENTIMLNKACTYTQNERKVFFENAIPLKAIRRDLHLRSTFFSIELKGDSVLFHGRGYGHGVGLCQQGAIKMANIGINYKDIISFYYTNTSLIHYSELRYDFMP
ncbi:MAG: SpoIID/LytB domain-containing protein [Bacteroidales bacterium]|nr:SpoIID/LytB domain-containing protein [Bacteroidales bacterium]